ncbi:hypothetical protein BB561_006500 [Smittium simulii]|uniref:Mitochondrial distribution and morphology protein 12 n=1 Tax=Smittium simulii TaxID=133385 RepID=A0A2T9Y3N5_9FUNG|nr:hypothetical protein BB561_006500 [Smittium simulii]
MSFDIDWCKLDTKVNEKLTQTINDFFSELKNKPSIIGELKVINLDLGTKPPHVELLDITEPFSEFYMPTKEEIDQLDNSELEKQVAAAKAELEDSKAIVNKLENSLYSSKLNYYDQNTPENYLSDLIYSRKVESVQNFGTFGNDHSFTPVGIRAIPETRLTSIFNNNDSLSIHRDAIMGFRNNNIPPNQMNHLELDHNDIGLINDNLILSDLEIGSASGGEHYLNNNALNYTDISSNIPESYLNQDFRSVEDIYNISKSEDDMQIYFKLGYAGDISIKLTVELQLNYPANSFMSLPITCHVTNLKFNAVLVVAYLKNKINICFLEPELPRTSLLDDLSIRSEIGDGHQHVLKNVETVEKFIVEQLKKSIDENFVFPSYTSIEFND